MLIGIDASRANRKFKGGTEWYSFYLIKELAEIDSVNQYILYSDQPLVDDLKEIINCHKNFKAKILTWSFVYLWTQVRLSWEMLFHAPDVLFVPAHTLPLLHPKKSLVTIHDIGFWRQKELYGADKIGPENYFYEKLINFFVNLFTGGKFQANVLDYHDWSVRHVLKRAAAVIAVSEFTKQELIEVYGAPADKIKVVHNGYNERIYKEIDSGEMIGRILNKYGIKRPYIFYAGRLEKKKNTGDLVKAFALLKENYPELPHKLVLAGNASLGFDEIKYIIEEYDLNNDIIFTGWVPEDDMPYIYAGADLFVFPSLYEGFGIPLLEAMACRVPIAASAIAPLREVAGEAALYFTPTDQDDMAETMAKILLDKKLAQDLAARGARRLKNFSLTKCAQETLAVLKKL